jgi:hypothetical protein
MIHFDPQFYLHQNGSGDVVHDQWAELEVATTNLLFKQLQALQSNGDHPANLLATFEFYSHLPQLLAQTSDDNLLAKYHRLVGILESALYEYFNTLDEWEEQGDINLTAKCALGIYYDWTAPLTHIDYTTPSVTIERITDKDILSIDPETDLIQLETELLRDGLSQFVPATIPATQASVISRVAYLAHKEVILLQILSPQMYAELTRLLIDESKKPFVYNPVLDGLYASDLEYNKEAAELRYISTVNKLKRIWKNQGQMAYKKSPETDNPTPQVGNFDSIKEVKGRDWLATLEVDFANVVTIKATTELEICITGKFGLSRQRLIEIIVQAGHKHTTRLSQTSILLAGLNPSDKLSKAREKGNQILDFGQFVTLLSGGLAIT